MALTKIQIGSFVEQYNQTCNISNLTPDEVSGINRDKVFFEPSRQVGGDTSKYKIVPPDCFACNLMHVGRDIVLPVALNTTNSNKVVSPAYTIFSITNETLILKEYFYILLNSDEKDRYFWFNTDSSVRDGMSWEDFCNLEIQVPSLTIQQKYVDVYKAMLANQKNYERGLEDLKLTCDAYIESLGNYQNDKIGNYIERNDKKNNDEKFDKTNVKGFNNDGEFIKPMRLFSGDISTFKIIEKGDFVYNPRINKNIKRLSIALNEGNELIVSPAYESFSVTQKDKLHPFYLYMLLQRDNFAKKVLFNSFGSATLFFRLEVLEDIEIPIPDIESQKALVNIYRTYKERAFINDKLKSHLKNICPILIKGSLEEARREEAHG